MGRPKQETNKKDDCFFCEGRGVKYNEKCPPCDGTGKKRVQIQMQKVYNAKNDLPIYYNLDAKRKPKKLASEIL